MAYIINIFKLLIIIEIKQKKMEDKIIFDKDLIVKENNCLKEKIRDLEESLKAKSELIESLKLELSGKEKENEGLYAIFEGQEKLIEGLKNQLKKGIIN